MFKQNVIIDAKWHRICFCFSKKISYKQIEENLEKYLANLILFNKNWNKYKAKVNQNLFKLIIFYIKK